MKKSPAESRGFFFGRMGDVLRRYFAEFYDTTCQHGRLTYIAAPRLNRKTQCDKM